MRVAYFDLGFSREQYGLQPTRYGGGAVAARYLKEDPEVWFDVFAPQEAFENVMATERRDRCHPVDQGTLDALRAGYPVGELFNAGYMPDLILHPHTCVTINRGSFKGPIVHFCGFDGSAGHPGNDYVLLYDSSFTPRFGERAKYVRIGKPVPATFTPSVKEDFVFSCCRHDDHMNSIALAKSALDARIPCVFAGPIHGDYRLLDYIDGKTTTYLGEIDEQTKLDYCRRARLFSILYAWDLPFSQSLIEAQGQGTPIYVNRRGPFLKTYLKHGRNGFDASLCTLEQAFAAAGKADYGHESWTAARRYDVSVMCSTFKQAFTDIVAEWRAEHPSP